MMADIRLFCNDELSYLLGSGIPVGIAIGRQRQPGTSSVVPPTWPLTSPTGCGPGSGSGSSSHMTSHPHPPGAAPTPLPPGAHPHPWMTPHFQSPAGPIPMGYQLAKDPLTGQILLIPTGKMEVTYTFKNILEHEQIF